MAKVLTPELIHVFEDGLVKLDGVTVFRKIFRDGKLFLQFHDRDRMRSRLRKTPYVEIEIETLIQIVKESQPIDPPAISNPITEKL